MYVEVVTTITSRVPLEDEGFGKPDVAVEVVCDTEGVPAAFIYAIAIGGARSAEKAMLTKQRDAALTEDIEGDDDV